VGILARDIEIKAMSARNNHGDAANDAARAREDDIWNQVEEFVQPNAGDDDMASKSGTATGGLEDAVLDGDGRDELTGTFSQSQQMKIIELLGAWEDPESEAGTMANDMEQDISVVSILQFRTSLAFLDARDMFGFHFGPTDTREHCIESSEEGTCCRRYCYCYCCCCSFVLRFDFHLAPDDFRVSCILPIVYGRLLLRSNRDDGLSFHVLAMLALNSDGSLKQEKIKQLIQIFRPQRDGSLTTLDFVKSVDTVVRLAA
jgi:hypothetical protein